MTTADDFNPVAGTPEHLEDGLMRILAPNPSPMTYRGTNTYLLGHSDLAVIDPGPADPAHLQAILNAPRAGQRIRKIIVTHTHLDHSPLAAALSKATKAPIYAFGNADAGRSPIMQELANSGMIGGGEGMDVDFQPHHTVADGAVITGSNWQLDVIHTPGHIGNHICLAFNDICFTADHVMGWASSLVSPPDGDLTDFMASCRKLEKRNWRIFYPGHGAPILNPQERLHWLITHRLSREQMILDHLAQAPATAGSLALQIYTTTPKALMRAATRNVLAHLIDLQGKSLVAPLGPLGENTTFKRL